MANVAGFGTRPVNVVWVSLKTGVTIKGVLVDRSHDALLLKAASIGSLDQQTRTEVWTPMLGDVVIPGDNIDYYQQGLDPHILD